MKNWRNLLIFGIGSLVFFVFMSGKSGIFWAFLACILAFLGGALNHGYKKP
jgi:hypothetical protein